MMMPMLITNLKIMSRLNNRQQFIIIIIIIAIIDDGLFTDDDDSMIIIHTHRFTRGRTFRWLEINFYFRH